LLGKIQDALSERVEAVNVSRRLVNSPACVVASDQDLNPQVRRMLEASGQELPESKPILEINVEHPLVTKLSDEADDARFGALSNIVLDHALLAEGSQLANPAEYVQRMNDFLLNNQDEAGNE
jgi:molecular chaperone HtpG